MKHFFCMFIFLVFLIIDSHAQEDTIKKPVVDSIIKDSIVPKRDSVRRKKDSITRRKPVSPARDTTVIYDSLVYKKDTLPGSVVDSVTRINNIDSLVLSEKKDSPRKLFSGKESLFYYLVFLLIIFGLLRQAFPKYFYDLFRVFFRTTIKQKQVREQLLQSALPSILVNGFFVLSAGLYASFLLRYFNFSLSGNFWIQYLYCVLGLSCIYMVKFLVLKTTGLLFNARKATDSYIFIVFIINKMIGIILLPFLVLLAFTSGNFYQAVLVISWIVVGLLYCYRFFLTYTTVHNEIRLNPFHFILYLAAFEIIPLLLIYKLLLIIF